MVIWLIGLSASGKTTIGRKLQALLDSPRQRWVLVDGDAFREVMGGETGHGLEERRKNAYRISRLCRMLELQDVNVIACVLSLFPDNRDFNRSLFADYREVYVKVPMERLEARDNKGLYASARSGALKEVAGVDLDFPEPSRPDLVLDNAADTRDFTALARQVAAGLGLEPRRGYGYPRPGHAPEKYQYAPFEGPEFLVAYRAQREGVIASLSARLSRLEAALAGLAGGHFLARALALPPLAGLAFSRELLEPPASASGVPAAGILATRDFLLAWLRSPVEATGSLDGLTALLKRFEVTKKVHSAYKVPEWRKADGAAEHPLDRMLLASALLRRSATTPDRAQAAIALNAALKLGDLIAASAPELATPSELYLARAVLAAELEAFARWQETVHA